MTIKTLIVDDERLARKELIKLLQDFPEIEIIDEAENAFEAKEIIDKKNPDLVFLDVQMPQKTGFDLLSEIEHIPLVIFTTAYDNYAIKAFELNAFDYLLKPIEPQRLAASLATVKLEFQKINQLKSEQHQYQLNENDQVFVKDGERCWFVKLSDIRLFESVGNYSKVYFGNVNPLILKSLNYLEERINPK
ncbi:MAG: response regulator, partial [Sediminibacterium sp.]|nr:response regulator [Sediminibacterium sp.]